jgi:mono/diheme cytochrome c family protein
MHAQGGMGIGRSSGMMERHHALIPQEYSGLTSPVAADEASITRGGEIFAVNCASCHGDGGMGDGIAIAGLDPAPAPIAHTTQKMGDNYLFWRISEGGAQFNSAMPAWKDILDEQSRWDVINYVRALGAGKAAPASQLGGALYDPELQAAHQAEMLKQAVTQGVLTQEEADLFSLVHEAVEQYRVAHPEISGGTLSADERQAAMLVELVKLQTITQEQADLFQELHDRLHAAGLMQ